MIDAISDTIVDVFSFLIEAIFFLILEPFLGIDTLEDLVFGTTESEKYQWGIFNSSVYNDGFVYFYNMSWTISLIVFAALIVIYGINVAMKFGTPNGRVEAYQNGFLIFLVGSILMALPLFYDLIFDLNQIIVNFFSTTHDNLISMEDIESGIGNAIGRILIQLVVIGLAVWANFYYMMRGITLFILLGLGPIFVVMFINPKLRSLTMNWMRESASTILIQSIHAMVFWVLTVFTLTATNIITTVIAFVIFIPVTVMVRSLFGINPMMQDNLNRTAAAFGMTGLLAVGGAVKGAMNGKSLGEIASSAMSSVKDKVAQHKSGNEIGDVKDTVQGNDGSDLAAEKNTNRLLRNGEMLKNIGKGTFGAMGAVAGMGLGPMGAFTGANMGSYIGGEASGIIGRTGTAAIDRLNERKKRMDALFNPVGSTEDTLDGTQSLSDDVTASAETLAENEAHKWAEENKENIMSDLKNRFPNASEGELQDMYENTVGSRKAQLTKKYQDELSNLVESNETVTDLSKDDVSNLKEALFEKWEDNGGKSDFEKEYRKLNPRKIEESGDAYHHRMNNAYKAHMDDQEQAIKSDYAMRHPQVEGESDKDFQQRVDGAYNQHLSAEKEGFGRSYRAMHPQQDNESDEDYQNRVDSAYSQHNDNQKKAFEERYRVQNPKAERESDEAFEERMGAAYTQNANRIKEKIGVLTNNSLKNAKQPTGLYNHAQVAEELNNDLVNEGIIPADSGIVTDTVNGFKKNALLTKDGRLDYTKVSDALVQNGVMKEKANFIQASIARGSSKEEAEQDWKNDHEAQSIENNRLKFDKNTYMQHHQAKDQAAFIDNQTANGITQSQAVSNWSSSGQAQASKKMHQLAKQDKSVQQLVSADREEYIAQEMANGDTHHQALTKWQDSGKHEASTRKHVQSFVDTGMVNEKSAFIKQLTDANIPESEANTMWTKSGQEYAQTKNEAAFRDVSQMKHGSVIPAAVQAVPARTFTNQLRALQLTTAEDAKEFVNTVKGITSTGVEQAKLQYTESVSDGNSRISSVGTALVTGFKGTASAFTDKTVNDHGTAVEAQKAFVDKAGYIGGVFLGKSGHSLATSLATKFTPLQENVQQEIRSASEIIQMAQKTTNAQGMAEIVPGAIRQVVSNTGSYIEVLTDTGARQQVSRITGGHANLKDGEVVYQDLAVQNGMLSAVKRGTHDTYRELSDGSVMPSDVVVSQNPNTLIRQKVNVPNLGEGAVFTDAQGVYSPNEVYHLAARDSEGNIAQGAIRQVTTAQESYIEVMTPKGTTHIVSRKREGDNTLQPNETVFTNLEVKDNSYATVNTRVGDELSRSYAVDTAGGYVKRDVTVVDPNVFNSEISGELDQLKDMQTFSKGKEYPVFNHQIDTGQFFTEHIANNGIENIRMIVENNRRFVVGDREGTTYRISKMTAGDMRVSDNEVHQIDLQLDGQILKPVEYINDQPNVAASTVQRVDGNGLHSAASSYSGIGLDKAIISQLMLHIMSSQELRKQVSTVRQPQSMAN